MAAPPKDITVAYGEALVEIGRSFPEVVVLDADIADSCLTEAFREAFPERSFDLGVAEQSLPTFAAGLALVGKIPFYNSFAVFAVHRGLDMIRQSVAYNRANVKIVGHAAGQSMGYTGPSHHTIEDFAVLRALPGMVILSPCDAEETAQMVRWMAEYRGPVYLRLTRGKVPALHGPDYRFEPGKTECLREGRDVSLFATGDVVHLALEARDRLQSEGLSAQVVNVPTVKPLEPEQIIRHGRSTQAAVTVEDHSVLGGLGSAVAEIYSESLGKRVKRIGIPDTFTESEDGSILRAAYGISAKAILEAAREVFTEGLSG